jgi:hypothetical protein
MATDLLRRRDLLTVRQWRIVIKSEDGAKIDYEEPFVGNALEAKKRTLLMWARTSFVVNKRESNRDVYARLDVFDPETHQYRTKKEKRGRLPKNAKAPAGS